LWARTPSENSLRRTYRGKPYSLHGSSSSCSVSPTSHLSISTNRFKFKTVTSGDFKDFFIEFFTTTWDPLSSIPSTLNLDSSWEGESFQQQADKETSADSTSEKAGATVVKYFTDLLSTDATTPEQDEKNKEEGARLKKEVVAKLAGIKWAELFHTKGMPTDPVPSFDNSLTDAAEALANKWIVLEEKTSKESSGSKADLEVSNPAPVSCTI
jgi:hypothetical protein